MLEQKKIRLANLTLSNYRNFGDAELELSPGLTVFQGMNGQGKSNLLEAVYLLSVAKSPRASQDRALVAWDVMANGGHAQIVGVARSNEQTTKIQIDFEAQPADGDYGGSGGRANGNSISVQKSLRVNGVKRSASDFVGALNVVSFAVEDLELVTGGPAVRRRYLDILISQGDATYLKALQRYQRVLAQRNNMLRQIRDRRASTNELLFWDERLCEEGAAIVEKRALAVGRLRDAALASHLDLADGDDSLALEYVPALGPSGPTDSMTTVRIAALLEESLGVLRDRELARGVTTVGPHRDELEISLAGRSAAVFASRGQARTIALSLKHAEGHLVSESTGRSPVLALDDVLSELDENRRRLVLEAASKYEQVLLTTTDFSFVESGFLADAETFTVDRGSVGRVGL